MIKQISTKIVYQNQWMKVREDEVEFPNAHKGIYGVVEKDHFSLIVPFDGINLHLVRQYRYPIGEYSLEFPQGKHETHSSINPVDLATAELEEEIGLKTKSIIQVGFLYEAPGYSNQGYYLFLAKDLYKGESKPDITETDLEHVEMTLQEFEQSVMSGEITDSPTVSAYGLLKVKKLI